MAGGRYVSNSVGGRKSLKTKVGANVLDDEGRDGRDPRGTEAGAIACGEQICVQQQQLTRQVSRPARADLTTARTG